MRILDDDPYGAGRGSDEARPITPTVLERVAAAAPCAAQKALYYGMCCPKEKLFSPRRQRLRRYADADANVGVGEAEV